MTTVDRNWLSLFITLALLALVAAVFAMPVGASSGPGAFYVPIILFIEFIAYFIGSMVPNPKATIGMAFGSAIVLMLLRLISSFVGIALANVLLGSDAASFSQLIWSYMNPIVVIIQAVVLLFAGGYILATILPDLVGKDMVDKLIGGSSATGSSTPAANRVSVGANPTGGFVQVFSYEELSSFLKKSPGVEGFMILNNEGLVVWKDFPMRVDVDVLAAKFLTHAHSMSILVERSGLTKARRVMVESREHFIYITTLDQNFSLMLVFNGRVSSEDIMARLGMLAKSCREFLQWKYPSLPLRNGAMKELSLVSLDNN